MELDENMYNHVYPLPLIELKELINKKLLNNL